VNATVKIRGPISGPHAPGWKEERKHAGLSNKRHYSCGCNCNEYCGYHDGGTWPESMDAPVVSGLILAPSTFRDNIPLGGKGALASA